MIDEATGTALEQKGAVINPFASPDSPALPPPAREPDAHRAAIVAVTRFVTPNTGTTGIQIDLTSLDTGAPLKYTIWPPKGYVADIFVDPNTLSQGESVVGEDGNTFTKGDERTAYAKHINNSKGTATFNRLIGFAVSQGRDVSEVANLKNFDDAVSGLNSLLSGVEVVVTRRPQRNSPEFLEVNSVLPVEAAGDPKFKFKGIRKMWEVLE